MRWQFVDRIDRFEPWENISGRKGISLEEYSLLEPFKRKGIFPENLILESCVHLARWLVMKSSDFCQLSVVSSFNAVQFHEEAVMGDVLSILLTAKNRSDTAIEFDSSVKADKRQICSGMLEVSVIPMEGTCRFIDMKLLWQELYGTA
ncbi:hypothetical protein ACFL6F_03205 [Planctomycetota bacterium]